LAQLPVLKKLGVLDRVLLFAFSNGPNSPYFEEEKKKVEIAIFVLVHGVLELHIAEFQKQK
jgi:hypothetical protein